MRVLVVGDRGYIGSVLVPFVQAAGHQVVGFDVGWYDGCDFGAQPDGYEQRTGDIRDVTPKDVEDLERPDRPPKPGGHPQCQRTRRSAYGTDGLGDWGSSVPLLLVVLALWCSWQ